VILNLELPELALIWTITVAASVLRSFTGFGFALAAVPGFALFLPPEQAVVLSASLSVALGVQTFPQYAGKVSPREQWPLVLMAVVGTIFGAQLLQSMSDQVFGLAIGLTVIVASLVLARFHPRHTAPSLTAGVGAGLCSGLMNGAFAIPGPPIVVYVMATESDPARGRALMIAFFTFSSIIALLNYAVAGLVGLQSLWLLVAAYPAMYVGDKLGYALFRRAGGGMYRGVAVGALMLIGLAITLRSVLA
jgi:uncharacterized membrane protein YfcA